MIRIKALKRGAELVGFEATGHAGYAEYGSDIVCAAVSALMQTCEIGLTDELGLSPEIRRGRSGRYSLRLSGDTPPGDALDAQLLLRTLFAGLHSIEQGYPDCVRIET